MNYRPRPGETRFLLDTVLGAGPRLRELAPFAGHDEALHAQVLDQAAKFVAEVLAPLGFRAAYRALRDGGWLALSAASQLGGQVRPTVLEAVFFEWLNAADHGLAMVLMPKLMPDGSRNAADSDHVERKRLHVALQGIGLLDAAWQKADAYAHEQRQREAAVLQAERPAIRRIFNTQRAWIDGARLVAYRTAVQLDIARHDADPRLRDRAQRWCTLATPVLEAACTRQAFDGASQCLEVFGGHGNLREWGIGQLVRDARLTMMYEGANEIQAIDLLVRKVLPDGGAAMSGLLIELRDELDASRDVEADVQRRLAQLRYLGTSIAVAAHADAALPCEVADDYLRVVMLAMLAWAWARIERAAPDDARWSRPAAAFRRWVLPEFDMRLGIVKRACDAVRQAG